MVLLRLVGALLVTALMCNAAAFAASSEYQVKAVFLLNFARFIQWPEQAFAAPEAPFVICVFGKDPFGDDLDEVLRGESIDGRAFAVSRLSNVADVGACHILFIDQSQRAKLPAINVALQTGSTLTVTDFTEASTPGAMIRFVPENNRLQLHIDLTAARAAGLTISSKLLRPAKIVATAGAGV